MRDANRIDPMIEQLRAAWKAHPDLRLGQLVYNAARPAEPCPRLFYIEDGPLLAGLTYRPADPWDACLDVDHGTDFYEDDEPAGKIRAEWAATPKHLTGMEHESEHEHGDACESCTD